MHTSRWRRIECHCHIHQPRAGEKSNYAWCWHVHSLNHLLSSVERWASPARLQQMGYYVLLRNDLSFDRAMRSSIKENVTGNCWHPTLCPTCRLVNPHECCCCRFIRLLQCSILSCRVLVLVLVDETAIATYARMSSKVRRRISSDVDRVNGTKVKHQVRMHQ